MSKVKKNVYQEFMQTDYVPGENQWIVKYLVGRGNNLHEVEDIDGSKFLVTMPKKFRQTVWLKKHDCLVVDPIAEGKKVLGEIICVVPAKSVVELIESGEWIPKTSKNLDKDSIIHFYKSHLMENRTANEDSMDSFLPSTDTEEEEDEEDENEENDDENQQDSDFEDDNEDNSLQELKQSNEKNSTVPSIMEKT